MSLAMLNTYNSDSSESSESHLNACHNSKSSQHHQPPLTTPETSKEHVRLRRTESCNHNAKEVHSTLEESHVANADIPAEMAAELRRAGHDLAEVNFIDIDATTNVRLANSNDHIPASALRNSATRLAQQISKSRNVGRVARRKHQITALAADALALQAAQAVLPGSASRRKR